MIMTHSKTSPMRGGVPPASGALHPDAGEYHIELLSDRDEIARQLDANSADYVVLGTVLPAHSGKELCRLLRNADGSMKYPVLLLRAANGKRTPWTRDHGHLPDRDRAPATEVIRLKDIEIHPGRHEVIVAGQTVDFSATEFKLLRLFAEHPGWVFSRDQMLEHIRGQRGTCASRAIDVLIVGLRRKLGPVGRRIQSVRSVGYRYRE